MRLKEFRCPHPCHKSSKGTMLFSATDDATGGFCVKCTKKKKCIVTYNATTKTLDFQPTKLTK